MRLQIDRGLLVRCASRAESVARKKNPRALLAASGDELVIEAFNGECWVTVRAPAEVGEQGAMVVNLTDLLRVARTMTDTVTLSVGTTKYAPRRGDALVECPAVVVSDRGSRATLPADYGDDHVAAPPRPDGVVQFTVSVDALAHATQLVSSVVDDDIQHSRPVLSTAALCVDHDRLRLLAASNVAGARAFVNYEDPPADEHMVTLTLYTHRALASLLPRERGGLCSVSVHTEFVEFQFADMTITAIPMGTAYPDLEGIIAHPRPFSVTVAAEPLLAATRRALTFTAAWSRLSANDGAVELFARGDGGDVSTIVQGSGDGLWEVQLNPSVLSSLLGQLIATGARDVVLSAGAPSLLITAGDYTAVLMGMTK